MSDKVIPLSKAKQIDLNKNVINDSAIKDMPEIKEQKQDTLDKYLQHFIPDLTTKYEKTKSTLLFSKDVVHMIVREFCLDSNFYYNNSTWAIRLIVSHVSDEKTFIPEKSEQYVLPHIITDRKYMRGDFVRLGDEFDLIGGKQLGGAVVTRVEHTLYTDNSGVLWLSKTFVKNEAAFEEYKALVSKRAPTTEQYNESIKNAGQKNNGVEA